MIMIPIRSGIGRGTMQPIAIETIGTAAAIVTTICWVPQAVHILRTRDTRAISLWMQAAMTAGIFLWLVYGVLIADGPLIWSNIVTLMLVAAILCLKLRYG
jgi:MtN3 and saliva related transmembrane protein